MLLGLWITVCWAQDAEQVAEARRLESAIVSLAERNAWSGVEDKYRELSALGIPVSARAHRNGAAAARTLGDATAWRSRLLAAIQAGDEDALDELEGVETAYGRVLILAAGPITLDPAPFSPEPRAAAAFASDSLKAKGSFDGLIPVGTYAWSGPAFSLEAGMGRQLLVTPTELGWVSARWAPLNRAGDEAWRWNGVTLSTAELPGLFRTHPATALWVERAEKRRRSAILLAGGGAGLIGYRLLTVALGTALPATGPLIVGPAVVGLLAAGPVAISGKRARNRAFSVWQEGVDKD